MPEHTDYEQGFIDGISAYAWWRDGVQYVGTTGRTLADAIERIRETSTYSPPEATDA